MPPSLSGSLASFEVRSYILEKINIRVYQEIGRRLQQHEMNLFIFDHIERGLFAQLEVFLAGKQNTSKTEYKTSVPLTWWDHFKEAHMPQWFVKRFPIKYKEIVTEIKSTTMNICPHIQLPSDARDHFEFVAADFT